MLRSISGRERPHILRIRKARKRSRNRRDGQGSPAKRSTHDAAPPARASAAPPSIALTAQTYAKQDRPPQTISRRQKNSPPAPYPNARISGIRSSPAVSASAAACGGWFQQKLLEPRRPSKRTRPAGATAPVRPAGNQDQMWLCRRHASTLRRAEPCRSPPYPLLPVP